MDTESESIDISSLKLRALRPVEISEQGSHEQISAVQAALHKAFAQSAPGNDAASIANTVDTSALPSTVPESADINAVLQSLPREALQKIVKRMSSQGEATQELSPTEFDFIVSKSRSVMIRDDETQHTLNEGDDGHIDITSSFVQPDTSDDEADGEANESQPADFSPTQTQSRLPKFPESQRFKTPATAGRKRDYNGNTKETPDLPRPDFRNGEPTPAHVMGLSQAFAATQAATSPFLDGIANPLSDRPSPNINLEVRPATATTSSPLRPISEYKRATTEPASRYVPIAHSQAERDRIALLSLPEDVSDDDFTQKTTYLEKQRRQRDRAERIKDQFRMASSPTKRRGRDPSKVQSSPVRPNSRSSPSPAPELLRASQRSPPGPYFINDDVDMSEAETEQEDGDDEDGLQRGASPNIDEEDKENDERLVQIPQTTVRLQKVMNDVPTQVEQSPLMRRGDQQYQSSAPVAVANSQPSQPHTRSQRQQPKSSSNSGIDFVPQSQAEPAQEQRSPQTSKNDSRDVAQETTGDDPPQQQHSSAPAQLAGTIPETSSSRQVGQPAPPIADPSVMSRSTSTTNFETAPSHLPPPASSRCKLLEMSSPPILTTPPGRKRRRMADISADPSPQQSTQGFDAVEALLIDTEVVGVLSQSPMQARSKRRKMQPLVAEVVETHTPIPYGTATSRLEAAENHVELAAEDDVPTHEAASNPVATPPRPTMTQRSGLRRAKPSTSAKSRTSVWEVEDSPQKPTSPILHQAVQPVQARRALRKSVQVSEETPQVMQETHDLYRAQLISSIAEPKPLQARMSLRKAKHSEQPAAAELGRTQETGSTVIVQPLETFSPVKPLRHEAPSNASQATPVEDIVAPDMVFACFNGKSRAYYPARCLECIESDPPRYRIQWEGYVEPDEVDAYGVKAIDIRVGDHVKIDLKGFAKVPYVVRGFKDRVESTQLTKTVTDIRGFKTVLVAPKQRKSLPAELSTEIAQEAPVSALYLDSVMWNQMKNRLFDFRPQSQSISTSGFATPMELPSTPTSSASRSPSRSKRQTGKIPPFAVAKSDGVFANMVFAVSYDDASQKNRVVDLVRENGGTIIRESFTELLQTENISVKPPHSNVGFSALLADKMSRKEKYMQALALGLPCLSGKWIEACINAEVVVDWQTYLLPAGESDALDGAIRSRVLPLFDAKTVRLVDMLEARPRPLEAAKVAVVVGRGKAEAKRKPYMFLLQALGAQMIEKVVDLKAAKDMVIASGIDWLFVEDRDVKLTKGELAGKKKGRTSCKAAGNQMIVQSLILGKLYGNV